MGIENCLQDTYTHTPFRLVYRKSCHLPVELEHKAYWAIHALNFGMKIAGEKRLPQLNELDELT